jgi:asparagine synthase (glutamine-hydrolysing)
MCGIIGISGQVNEVKLQYGVDMLSHRGPDDSGKFIDKELGIGLGHTRLSIQDVSSAGHQPMSDNTGKIVLVFNGEIYNFNDLKVDLEAKGYFFNGNSDTEVLLNLYIEFGKEMFTHLNGIFALAIWDKRNSSILIARDALGIKPLYYSKMQTGSVAFASEIKALQRLLPYNEDLDVESINRYLAFLWCPGGGTALQSIKKLLPGEAMIIKDGFIVESWPWYKLPIFNKPKKNINKEQAISGITKHLRQAVHRQMVSDVPLGAFLSGGLDSSAIVAFAKEKDPNIRCFTIETIGDQDAGIIDDLPYAKKVAKHLNVSLDVVTIDSHRMANDLESMVIQLDEPLADPAALNVLYISKLARQQGIKVLLSGAGGDDLFTGYRRHYALQLERYWAWMPKSARIGLESFTSNLNVNSPIQRRVKKMFSSAGSDSTNRLINYFRWSSDELLHTLYSPEFRHELADSNANQVMENFLEPIITETSSLDQMLALEQRFFLADHNLIYTDKMSMAEGVEVRTPFLDLDLVEFSSKIPNRFKQKNSVGKWVFKKAMEPILPREIIYRPKTGFGAPLRIWIKNDLREMLQDLLSSDSINRRGLFSAKGVQQLILDNDSGKIDASYTLLSLLCIEIWCRAYIN